MTLSHTGILAADKSGEITASGGKVISKEGKVSSDDDSVA
jgi:hypothetical protein